MRPTQDLFRSIPILRPHRMAIPDADHRETMKIRLALSLYFRSLLLARKHHGTFDGVRYYTFFIGWPRSGHSLFGSLLDAHPCFAIAHELDALPLVDAGLSRHQLFSLILENSVAFANSPTGRGWSGYSYAVPHQWQGRFDHLHVVGDKKAAGSTFYIRFINSLAIDKLRKRLGHSISLRVIFYHRNPFDIIATSRRRAGAKEIRAKDVEFAFDNFAPTVARLYNELRPEEKIEVFHEDFVAAPQTTLKQVVEAFGENATDSFLADACSIVKESPHKSRKLVSWTPDVIRLAELKMKPFEFIKQRYQFES